MDLGGVERRTLSADGAGSEVSSDEELSSGSAQVSERVAQLRLLWPEFSIEWSDHDLEDLLDFAAFLDVNPAAEPDLLHLVAAAMTAPCPDGWVELDDEDGNVYYHHKASNETSWEHPEDARYRLEIAVERARLAGQPPPFTPSYVAPPDSTNSATMATSKSSSSSSESRETQLTREQKAAAEAEVAAREAAVARSRAEAAAARAEKRVVRAQTQRIEKLRMDNDNAAAQAVEKSKLSVELDSALRRQTAHCR